jgi:hypothetical protein
MAGIGRDLLDLPFAELVRNLAIAIADGQTALDRNSLETLKTLAETDIELITDLTEVIRLDEHEVDTGEGRRITVTGARVDFGEDSVRMATMSMFQAGLLPTFYQFTEASIEVRLSITMREDRDAESTVRTTASGPTWLGMGASRAFASSVDYRSANKYSYAANGASVLRCTMRPVPPPTRLEPAVTTVNLLTDPPTVTRTPG